MPLRAMTWPDHTGDHRMWNAVVPLLAAMCDVRVVPDGRERLETPLVWLAAALGLPVHLTGPAVLVVNEVPLADRRSRHTLDAGHRIFERRLRVAASAARHVITLSEASRQQIVEWLGVPASRVTAVHLGVDHRVFGRPRTSHHATLIGDVLPPGTPYILCVSTAHPRKNLSALRTAFANLVARGFPHHLVLVTAVTHGYPDAAAHLASAIADIAGAPGRLHHVANAADAELAALMTDADVFCLPSLMEGFGLPVLEAMACGTPCVVSNRGSLPEVVNDSAITCDPTPRALEHALAEVLTRPALRHDLRVRATRRAAEFSWERTARGWFDVLEAVAGMSATASSSRRRSDQSRCRTSE